VEEAAAVRLQAIGKYELIASLGQGGMANVYLALSAGPGGFNKLLVLKLLREDVLAGMEEGVNMFLDEARLSARLVHPNIVHTYEVGEHEGRYFIAMEYLDGQTYRAIQQRARANGGIPVQEELRIIAETARGLHYSHELKGYDGEPLGVVHRDVSPQNVFVTYDGQVKVLDFGIAKTSDAEHLTQVGVIKGKLDYIAPEQLRGEALDGRADIFALGVMCWEAVTGKRFAGGRKVTDVTKVHLRLAGGEVNVRVAQPEIPEELAAIIDKAIALKPDARWPDAGSFADALDGYVQSVGQKPTGKTLAAIITPLFEEERAKMRKLVEVEVDRAKRRGATKPGEQTTSLPRLKIGDDSTSGMFVGGQESQHVTLDGVPRDLAPLQSVRAAARHKLRMRALSIGAACIVSAAVLLVMTRGSQSKSIAAAPLNAPNTVATGAAPVSDTSLGTSSGVSATPVIGSAALVGLQLKVTPEDARVNLDGATLAMPFSGQFRKDLALHHLEITSPGYRGQKQLIKFDQDRALEIVLERLPERAPQPQPVVRRGRSNEKQSAQAAEPTAKPEQPAPAASPPSGEPPAAAGDNGKDLKPRITRGRIDSNDPYSTGK
jgi:serine/threonine-protein kinase